MIRNIFFLYVLFYFLNQSMIINHTIFTNWKESFNFKSQAIKITIQFFSNEIRADGLEVLLHKKICDENNQCSIKKIDSAVSFEIKENILRKAALMKKENEDENKKKGKKKKGLESLKNKKNSK